MCIWGISGVWLSTASLFSNQKTAAPWVTPLYENIHARYYPPELSSWGAGWYAQVPEHSSSFFCGVFVTVVPP